MRMCGTCGVPETFSRFFEWRSDGTLMGTGRARFNSVLLEAGEFESLFNSLSGSIGISIDPFIIQAQKDMGKALFARMPIKHMKRIPATRFMRPQWLSKLIVAIVNREISIFGIGSVRLDRYVPGEKAVVRVRHYCWIPALLGSGLGVYESLEEMPGSKAEYYVDREELVITFSPSTETDMLVSEERLHPDASALGEGPLSHRRCSSCGAPLLVGETFIWDLEMGAIVNRKTGAREVIVAIPSVNAVFRELEEEIGEEIDELAFDAQRELTVQRLRALEIEDPGAFWEGFLTEMGIRGLGYPQHFEAGGDLVSVRMHKAYNQNLYAARLAGAQERITGRKQRIVWEKREPSGSAYSIISES